MCKEKLPWWKADPGFWERFLEEFHRSRLPGAKWWSVAPPIGPLVVGGTYYGAYKLESMVLRRATERFSSFSGTRSFAYIYGYRPGFFVAAKVVRTANVVLIIPTAFYTGADIGTGIYSAIEAWRE